MCMRANTLTPWVLQQQCDSHLHKPQLLTQALDGTEFGCGFYGNQRWPACFSSSSSSESALCAATRADWKRWERSMKHTWFIPAHSCLVSTDESPPSGYHWIHHSHPGCLIGCCVLCVAKLHLVVYSDLSKVHFLYYKSNHFKSTDFASRASAWKGATWFW